MSSFAYLGRPLYPLIVVEDLDAVRQFYLDRLEAAEVFASPRYLQVRFGEGGPELAFMRAGVTELDGTETPFSGRGVVVSIPVADADAHAAGVAERGIILASPPSDKPWQWRSFTVKDPSGLVLDFFHELKPQR